MSDLYEHVAMNSTRHRLTAAAPPSGNLHEWVEFRRISLTGFRNCTSHSHYRSVSKQTTRYELRQSLHHYQQRPSLSEGWMAMKEGYPNLKKEFLATVAYEYNRQNEKVKKANETKVYLQLYEAMEALVHICFWKEKETMFPVLSCMAIDLISVQASSVASESAFSTSGRVLSIRRTRLTPASLEMCMCLKDHLDAKERKQDKCTLETPLDFEEDVFDDEVQRNEAILLSDEIALDANASSEGTLSPGGPQYDYMMSSEAEDDY
nr:BTB/POZ and TAZ domain-containing protein 4-like [Tanacetum cinerariifolium]